MTNIFFYFTVNLLSINFFKMKKLLILLLALPLLCSCLSKTKVGRTALSSDVIYTDEVVQIDNLSFGMGVKEGRACGKNILGIVATGDMSVETAKREGNITNITAVSTNVKNMIIMSEVCTVVRGY